MTVASSFLAIDTEKVCQIIDAHIKHLTAANNAAGAVLGLSGGVDSALLATLAVHALGRDAVSVYYLYDRDNKSSSLNNARLVADWLGLKLQTHNIEPAMRAGRVYEPMVMELTSLSGLVNRLLGGCLYRLLFGQSPFMTTLQHGSLSDVEKQKGSLDQPALGIEAAFNARHIYRRRFLEDLARRQNQILLGAANRSEVMVGWFVKDGIDDMPLSPLAGLYKTQIKQLARHLSIPARIIDQKPSPDMLKGITDEFALGVSYPVLDMVLDGINAGFTDSRLKSLGISAGQIDHVRKLNELSAWKRTSHHYPPPVDGGPYGGFRINCQPVRADSA